MRSIALALLLLPLASCESVQQLDAHCPPPEYGRPGWVRAGAKVGAWVGAVPGAFLTVLALPITWPMTLLADEPLGYSKNELIYGPLTACAATGHFLIGAPLDSAHWVFYRAWTDQPSPVGYEFTPVAPPRATKAAPVEMEQPADAQKR